MKKIKINDKKVKTIINIIFAIIFMTIGFYANNVYSDFQTKRLVNGVYFENLDYDSSKEYASQLDQKGDWVCVNVAFDMSPKEAYKTCTHECLHASFSEIFAEKCDTNDEPLNCLENFNE